VFYVIVMRGYLLECFYRCELIDAETFYD